MLCKYVTKKTTNPVCPKAVISAEQGVNFYSPLYAMINIFQSIIQPLKQCFMKTIESITCIYLYMGLFGIIHRWRMLGVVSLSLSLS